MSQVYSIKDTLMKMAQLASEGEMALGWSEFKPHEWPALFKLMDVGATLDSLDFNQAAQELAPGTWENLDGIKQDALSIRHLRNHPIITPTAHEAAVHSEFEIEAANAELTRNGCASIDFFLTPERQSELEEFYLALQAQFDPTQTWTQLQESEHDGLFRLIKNAFDQQNIRLLLPERTEILNVEMWLAMQDLQQNGIGWHKDVYWPQQENVVTFLYSLIDDGPEKGGAFMYYVSSQNEIHYVFRKRGDATLMLNGTPKSERIYHAVSGYSGADTARHNLIIQCIVA